MKTQEGNTLYFDCKIRLQICLSVVCLYDSLTVCLFVCMQHACLFLSLSICMPAYVLVCLSICLSVDLSVRVSLQMSICLGCLALVYPQICLYFCLSVCIYVCLSFNFISVICIFDQIRRVFQPLCPSVIPYMFHYLSDIPSLYLRQRQRLRTMFSEITRRAVSEMFTHCTTTTSCTWLTTEN